MANVLKKEPGDIGRDEVIDFLKNAGVRGWSDKNFNERLMSFCSNYKLDYKLFYEDAEIKKPKVLIRNEYKDLVLALMVNEKNDPYIIHPIDRQEKTSIEKVMDYHATIIDVVENVFSPSLRFLIQSSRVYRDMVSEHVSMEAALGKINEVVTSLSMTSSEVRGQVWKEIYEIADTFLYKIFKLNNYFEHERKKLEKDEHEESMRLIAEIKECTDAISKGIAVDENRENRSRLLAEICEWYALHEGRDADNFLATHCANISEFLVAILKKELFCNKEAEKIQYDENDRMYDVYDEHSEDVKFLQAIEDIFYQNIGKYGDIEAKIAALLRESDEDIKKIKALPSQIETLEEDTMRKLIEWGVESETEINVAKCNEYSNHAKMIKQKTKERVKGRVPFSETLLAMAYRENLK